MPEFTVVELLEAATRQIQSQPSDQPGAAREFAIAITHIEDARMRFTRGYAKQNGEFRPVDLESL